MNSITGWVERHSLTEEQFQRIFDQEWVTWMMFVVIGGTAKGFVFSKSLEKNQRKKRKKNNVSSL